MSGDKLAGSRFFVLALVALLVLALAVTMIPRRAAADDYHTMMVWGYVYNSHGAKVAGASVTVTMYDGSTPGVSKSTTTGTMPYGYFAVSFENIVGNMEWHTGNTVQVVAEYPGWAQGVNASAHANGDYISVWENVTLPYEIPQFGGTVGLLITAGLVGVVASVILVWKRQSK